MASVEPYPGQRMETFGPRMDLTWMRRFNQSNTSETRSHTPSEVQYQMGHYISSKSRSLLAKRERTILQRRMAARSQAVLMRALDWHGSEPA
jgi:hypothetical protein